MNVPTLTSPKAFETACGPLGPEGRSLTENTLQRIQRRPTPPKSVSSHGGILVFGGLAVIFTELQFDFSTSSILQPKGQATPHANLAALRLSVTAE